MASIITSTCYSVDNSVDVYLDNGKAKHFSTHDSVYINESDESYTDAQLEMMFDITKSKDDEQLVSGWASVAVNADGSLPLDWQDDIIDIKTLESAAINFMLDYRESGVMHTGPSLGTVVESIVLTKEKQEALNIPEGYVAEGWFITVKVHDKALFEAVKAGKYKMFSIQGAAKRIKI